MPSRIQDRMSFPTSFSGLNPSHLKKSANKTTAFVLTVITAVPTKRKITLSSRDVRLLSLYIEALSNVEAIQKRIIARAKKSQSTPSQPSPAKQERTQPAVSGKAAHEKRELEGIFGTSFETQQEMREVWKRWCRKGHPDRGGSTQVFQRVQDLMESVKSSLRP